MTVFVLIREDQNEHGYIDTSVAGVFHDKHIAQRQEVLERRKASEEGLKPPSSACADWPPAAWACRSSPSATICHGNLLASREAPVLLRPLEDHLEVLRKHIAPSNQIHRRISNSLQVVVDASISLRDGHAGIPIGLPHRPGRGERNIRP